MNTRDTPVLDDAALRRLRLHAQGLAAPTAGTSATGAVATTMPDGAARAASVARHMLAMQGQDWLSSRWALGVRARAVTGADLTLADVTSALNSGALVRSWPVRSTIHLVAAEDVGWMQHATGRKPLSTAPKRRVTIGLDDATLERLVDVSLEALDAATPEPGSSLPGLTRDELATAWTEAGLDWKPNWRYHLLWWLCQNGLATLGPTDGRAEPRIVLAERWIRDVRTPADPLKELATRYATARGPVSAKDLSWWAGIGVRDARAGLEAAADEGDLVEASHAEIPGVAGRLWVDPTLLDAAHAAESAPNDASEHETPDWLLLPSFDEHLLGYTARDAQLDPGHFESIVPGKNGMFLATVVREGRVVGTWKRGRRGGLEARALPGERFTAADLEPLAEQRATFLGSDAVETGPDSGSVVICHD